MDSLNLSETQNASLNSKNTACNTGPIACAYCGSKYYIQILPQPYCFRVQQPEIPRCKHAQECFEENFTNPQPNFSPFLPFPLLHPFFPNSPLSVNSSYAYNHLDDLPVNEEKKDYTNECENIPHLPKKDTFCQREKNELKGNKTAVDENAKNYTNFSGPESHFQKHPFNSVDPHLNSVIQPCGWGDFIPWTCSPFFAPIISYCLLWNSQKFNANNPLKNFPGNAAETESQKNDERRSQPYSNANGDNKENERKSVNKRNSSIEMKCPREDCMEIEHYEINKKSSGNSTAVPMISPIENICKSEGKEEEITDCQKTSSDSCCEGEGEEDAEMEGFDSAVQVESDECFHIDGKEFSIYKTISSHSVEPSDKKNQSQGDSEISYLMKTRNNPENSMDGLQINSSDISITDENVFLSIQDQTNDSFLNDTNIITAAAGDLGGENCVGYKMIIEPPAKDDEEIKNETNKEIEQEEELEPKDLKPQDFEQQRKNNLTATGKNQNENSKTVKGFQSGIAKLSNISKVKESKTDTKKPLKYNKEPVLKERDFTKRKHSCIFNNNVNANENCQKIPKSRNCTGTQQQLTGMGKQQKEMSRNERIISLTRKKKNFSE